MQRKMKLIRKILEYVESSQEEETLPVPGFDDFSEAEIHYHVGLCEEAGYLTAIQPRPVNNPHRFGGIVQLNWEGHEALDRMRGPEPTH